MSSRNKLTTQMTVIVRDIFTHVNFPLRSVKGFGGGLLLVC